VIRFLDTSFVFALFRRRERHHVEAAALWALGDSVLTTEWVLSETWTLLRRKESHQAAVATVDALRSSPRVTVVATTAQIHDAAWDWLRRRDEHPYSFVDAVSFEVMRRRRLTEALAFDDDFTRAGYVEVRL
jgi:predicted nucleic acid-binding protein